MFLVLRFFPMLLTLCILESFPRKALAGVCSELVLEKRIQETLNIIESRKVFAKAPLTQFKPEKIELEAAPPGFKTLWVPALHTGIYVPIEFDPENPASYSRYQSFAIMMPGIGTENSTAKSLKTIGETLNSTKNPALKVDGGKLRVMPVLFDATLSGMDKAPGHEFSKPVPTCERLHRLVLIFRSLFGTPGFVGGRSQGGVYALEYAERFGKLEGVIAINPSPTEPDMHKKAVARTEAAIQAEIEEGKEVRVNKSFEFYRSYTDRFLGIRGGFFTNLKRRFFRNGNPPVPTLLLISSDDKDAPPGYVELCTQFAKAMPNRQVMIFDTTAHDLWYRGAIFKQVIAAQAAFMYRNLSSR